MTSDWPSIPPAEDRSSPPDLTADGFALDGDSWLERVRQAESPLSLGSIGDYRLECEVGRGAQGVVHRAVQPRTNRRIAIKRLITGSLADTRARARFEREVEACAALNHPNIVTVHGVDYVDGLPVLAMEWVDGLRIDEWSDRVGRERSSLDRLIAVILKACDAIQHAHQRGVIHRDIKPSNILVTERGDVRILDFGLAKFSTSTLPAALELTETGDFVGTPAYCAPEKLSGQRDVSEVRCDVFSLGVVLYRMLAGRLPFSTDGSLSSLLDTMRTSAPARPSAHNRAIPRELDAICSRAIAAEPERRYASVEHLADDLRRFLDGRPVSASSDSITYRASRFARRHKALVGSVTIVLMSLIAGAVVSTIFAFREAAARTEAERQIRVTRHINAFLNEDLLSSISPERTTNPDLTMREALDRAAERLDGRFPDDPVVEASIRQTLARTYLRLGLPSKAAPQAQRAYELRTASLGPLHADTRHARRDWIEALYGTDSDRAGAEAKELLTLDIEAAGSDSVDAMATRNWIARANPPADREERIALFRTLAEWNARTLGEAHAESLSSLHTLANELLYANRMEDAEPVIMDIWRIAQSHYGPAHPETFDAVMGRAMFLAKSDRGDEAIAVLEESVRIQRETMPENFTTTGIMLGHLGSFYGAEGRVDDSERALLEGYAILSTSLGPEIGWTQGIVRMLGDLYERKGDTQEASVWRSRLLKKFERG